MRTSADDRHEKGAVSQVYRSHAKSSHSAFSSDPTRPFAGNRDSAGRGSESDSIRGGCVGPLGRDLATRRLLGRAPGSGLAGRAGRGVTVREWTSRQNAAVQRPSRHGTLAIRSASRGERPALRQRLLGHEGRHRGLCRSDARFARNGPADRVAA